MFLTGLRMRLCVRGIGGEDGDWGVFEIRQSAVVRAYVIHSSAVHLTKIAGMYTLSASTKLLFSENGDVKQNSLPNIEYRYRTFLKIERSQTRIS